MEGFTVTLLEKRLGCRQHTLHKRAHGSIHGVKVEGSGIDYQVGLQQFGEQFIGHVILLNALARSLGPARKATDTVFNLFPSQLHDFNLSAGVAHALDKVIEHQFCFALASAAGAGING
jgi:hypothetical protein